MASNDTAKDALNFTGGGMTINLGSGSLSAAGGCTGSSTFCGASYTRTYMPPVTNPFSALDSITYAELSRLAAEVATDLTAYSSSHTLHEQCFSLTGKKTITLCGPGVYFISALTLKGGS